MKLSSLCIGCADMEVVAEHPLFQGSLCKTCKVGGAGRAGAPLRGLQGRRGWEGGAPLRGLQGRRGVYTSGDLQGRRGWKGGCTPQGPAR